MTSGTTFPVPCLSGEERGLFAPVPCLAQRGSPMALQDAHEPAWHLGARWHRRQCRGWWPGHLLLHGFSTVLSGAPEVTTRGGRDPVPSHSGAVVQVCAGALPATGGSHAHLFVGTVLWSWGPARSRLLATICSACDQM